MKHLLQTLPAMALSLIGLATPTLADEPAPTATADKSPPAAWQAMADAGDPLAQALLARAYLFGVDGKRASHKDAAEWAAKSAAQSHPLGWFLQGYEIFSNPRNPKQKREAEARPSFEKAIEAGFLTSAEGAGRQWLSLVGDAFHGGFGVAKSDEEAIKWYRKAAELNNSYAMLELGRCYARGTGIPKDETEAVRWYRKAAELDNRYAMEELVRCYMYGTGVPKDYKEALKWIDKAAAMADEKTPKAPE